MEKYCSDTENEFVAGYKHDGPHPNTKFNKNKAITSNIKECFVEYSVEDKIEALKHLFTHNERHEQYLPLHKNAFNTKKTVGVKECLYGDQKTPTQTLISELKNTVMNSYWNKEIGKTHYQVPNLPVGMNPLEVTFGRITRSDETMAKILQTTESDTSDKNILEMYKKSHNRYQPAERINRHYKEPFSEYNYFGKSTNKNLKEAKVKKLLKWFNYDPKVLVNSILADFKERSHPCVGQIKNPKNAHLYMNMVHGKPSKDKERHEAAILLSDFPINKEIMIQKKYLQYINSLRQRLKYLVPEIPFLDILEDLMCLDKDYKGTLPDDKVFCILAKYKIYVNKTLLTPLLNVLQISKEGNLNYTELLVLLNWKYDFPTLPKMDKNPIHCQYYNTTYNETMGLIDKVDMTNIRSAGISSTNLGDKTTVYSLICPNIFTKFGLSKADLTKLRKKEEIKDIFESIGVQFPNNSFSLLWKKGQKSTGTENLSVQVFKELLDQHDLTITD